MLIVWSPLQLNSHFLSELVLVIQVDHQSSRMLMMVTLPLPASPRGSPLTSASHTID